MGLRKRRIVFEGTDVVIRSDGPESHHPALCTELRGTVDRNVSGHPFLAQEDSKVQTQMPPARIDSTKQRRREKSWKLVATHYHTRGWRHAYKEYERLVRGILKSGSAVLDVGCGRDFPLGRFLVECGGEVHGVDPVFNHSQVPIPGVTTKKGTAEHIPYGSNTFDVLVSRCVLEHLREPEKAFTEFARVLKPGGRFVFLTPSRYDYVSVLAWITPNFLHGAIVKRCEGRDEQDAFPTFYKANSKRRVRRIATRCGFVVESMEYHNSYPAMFMNHPAICRVAIAYDACVSRLPCLSWLQGWLLGCLRNAKA